MNQLEAEALGAFRQAMTRRRVLQALGVGGAAALVGCSSEKLTSASTSTQGLASTSAATTTTYVLAPEPWDPKKPYWLQNNFAPVADQISATNLIVTGAIPSDLTGLYVRNGANPRNADSTHWFFGDGMVHGVRFDAGKVSWYKNQYVKTPQFRREDGDPSAPAATGIPGKQDHQGNTSMLWYANKLLALEEVGWPYELATKDLSTVGAWSANNALPNTFTAHPKVNPTTGQLHYFGYGFTPPYLTYGVMEPDGTVVSQVEIPVKGATMIHDFAITDTDAIFWELPIVFDLQVAIAGGNPFHWDPTYGARLHVLPLAGDVTKMRSVEIPPCFVFHGVNAFRDGTKIVLDVCRLDKAFDVDDDGLSASNDVRRWTIETAGTDLVWSETVLTDRNLDLPTIDKRRTGAAHRYSWMVGSRKTEHAFEFSGLTRWDHTTNTGDEWDPGLAVSAGEGLFVPIDKNEGDGWVMTFAYDKRDAKSRMMILDATAMSKGPIATIEIPQRVPFGFHGTWVPQ